MLIKGLTTFVIENKIDVLSMDPFISTHAVNENLNAQIRDVVEQVYGSIAQDGNCAVHLWHHTRKSGGGEVSVESARGAAAFVDTCRSVRILETMTQAEADKLSLSNHPGFFFREFSGKRNFAPPAEDSVWYRHVSVPLHNQSSDNVGVVERWQRPEAKSVELTEDNIKQITERVAAGQYRENIQAEAWVGKPVAEVLGLDPEDDKASVKKTIKQLLKEGVLARKQLLDPNRRALKTFIVPGDGRM